MSFSKSFIYTLPEPSKIVIPSLFSSPVQSFFSRALPYKLFEGNRFPTFKFGGNEDNRDCTWFSRLGEKIRRCRKERVNRVGRDEGKYAQRACLLNVSPRFVLHL
jgi:hypothetical protein